MEEEKEKQLHVVMFPWLAHGHITPFLELANTLHAHGLGISFVSTPLNIRRINGQLELSRRAGIDLVELSFPSVEGLPAGVESTADLKKGGTVTLLVEALDRCEKPFQELLERLSPNFVIHDFFQWWTPRVAANLGIPSIYLVILGAASVSYANLEAKEEEKKPTAEELTVPPPGFPSSVIRRRLFEARKLLSFFQENEKGISFFDRKAICLNESWAIACNTSVELEGAYLEYMQRVTGKTLLPVGILMPRLPPRPPSDRCLDWLDRHSVASVVFVSFGSECPLTSQDVAALALGLEESLLPFIYVLLGHDDVAAALPHGFIERREGRGVVVTQWVPQLHILNHPSTGAFLTHCGWNSLTEGLRFGVPQIALPMQFEQGLNARMISEELKLAVEVRRNEEDGSFSKEDICNAVRAVMVEEEGKQIKANIAEVSRVLTENDFQVHRTNIKNFVSALKRKALNQHSV